MEKGFLKKKDERSCEQCDLALGKHTCLLVLEGKEVCIYPTVYKFLPKYLLKTRRFWDVWTRNWNFKQNK